MFDATSPLHMEAPGQPTLLALGYTDSAGEQVQPCLADARLVKVFNIVGNAHLVGPDLPDSKPDLFICDNDAGAKQVDDGLIQSLGRPPAIDLSDITKARYIEPLDVSSIYIKEVKQ